MNNDIVPPGTSCFCSVSIPIEVIDDAEFEAIEEALELAQSQSLSESSCRLNCFPPEPQPTFSAEQHDSDSKPIAPATRRRLPDFSAIRCSVLKPVIPKICFGGRIVYSKTVSEIKNATFEVLRILESKKSSGTERVPLGFDLEWKPYAFGSEHYNKVAVLQLCGDANRCDVMHIFHCGIPPILHSLLENQCLVGVGIRGDRDKMLADYNIKVQDIEDLSSLANKKLGGPPRRWSLSALCERLTGKEVAKPWHIRCGNWEMKNLNIPQLKYAATDAFASWYIYEALKSLPDPI